MKNTRKRTNSTIIIILIVINIMFKLVTGFPELIIENSNCGNSERKSNEKYNIGMAIIKIINKNFSILDSFVSFIIPTYIFIIA